MDKKLAAFVNKLFRDGRGIYDARMAVYGVAYVNNLVTKDPNVLPWAKGQLQGWTSKSPDSTKQPMTEEALYLVSDYCLQQTQTEWIYAALALATQFDAYTRPSETLDLHPSCVLKENNKGSAVAISMYPEPASGRVAQRSKGKEYDDTVIIGDQPSVQAGRRWVSQSLALLAQKRKKHGKLFPLTLPRYTILLRKASEHLGLKLIITPHLARHGGPSSDYLQRFRDLVEIKRRGRWKAQASVRRYEKSGRYLRQREILGQSLRGKAAVARAKVPLLMAKRIRALP